MLNLALHFMNIISDLSFDRLETSNRGILRDLGKNLSSEKWKVSENDGPKPEVNEDPLSSVLSDPEFNRLSAMNRDNLQHLSRQFSSGKYLLTKKGATDGQEEEEKVLSKVGEEDVPDPVPVTDYMEAAVILLEDRKGLGYGRWCNMLKLAKGDDVRQVFDGIVSHIQEKRETIVKNYMIFPKPQQE